MNAEKPRKFSRKREAIRQALMNTVSHPSAEWIYAKLKPDIPDLSLATVYRNLNDMKSGGEIQSVGFWNGKERFDGRTDKHCHFICRECGSIEDLDFIKYDDVIDKTAAAGGRQVDYHVMTFHGICSSCCRKNFSKNAQ